MKTQVILDAGHRPQTSGKRSPDGRLIEHRWAVECRRQAAELLSKRGVPVLLLPCTDSDTEAQDLNARVRNINAIHRSRRSVAVSIHCNAASSNGKWNAARGWSVFVSPNASEASKHLAEAICEEARAHHFKVRQQFPNVGYWTQSLAFCRDTSCPAVLVENFFMDNPDDCAFLLSAEGTRQCAEVIADGIYNFLKSWGE